VRFDLDDFFHGEHDHDDDSRHSLLVLDPVLSKISVPRIMVTLNAGEMPY
jgi:hypothetical protein